MSDSAEVNNNSAQQVCEDEDEVLVTTSADQTPASKKLKGFKAIAAKMKEYEVKASVTEKLDPTKPFLLRLDGHCFSTFTSPFNKPFDIGLNEIMIRTAKDLLIEYNFATTAYTCSDEITLVFPRLIVDPADKNSEKQALLFSGRILKLSSLAAGYCSARFNYHCQKLREASLNNNSGTNDSVFWTRENSPRFDKIMEKLESAKGYFDGRAFNVEDEFEILENIMWRSNYDCARNSRTNLGMAHFTSKQMLGVKSIDVVAKLIQEKGIDWNAYPANYKYGTFIKRDKVMKEGFNPITKQETAVDRTVIVEKGFGFPSFKQEYVSVLLARYWHEVDGKLLEEMLK